MKLIKVFESADSHSIKDQNRRQHDYLILIVKVDIGLNFNFKEAEDDQPSASQLCNYFDYQLLKIKVNKSMSDF